MTGNDGKEYFTRIKTWFKRKWDQMVMFIKGLIR